VGDAVRSVVDPGGARDNWRGCSLSNAWIRKSEERVTLLHFYRTFTLRLLRLWYNGDGASKLS
jgi:hypothetical protein